MALPSQSLGSRFHFNLFATQEEHRNKKRIFVQSLTQTAALHSQGLHPKTTVYQNINYKSSANSVNQDLYHQVKLKVAYASCLRNPYPQMYPH